MACGLCRVTTGLWRRGITDWLWLRVMMMDRLWIRLLILTVVIPVSVFVALIAMWWILGSCKWLIDLFWNIILEEVVEFVSV